MLVCKLGILIRLLSPERPLEVWLMLELRAEEDWTSSFLVDALDLGSGVIWLANRGARKEETCLTTGLKETGCEIGGFKASVAPLFSCFGFSGVRSAAPSLDRSGYSDQRQSVRKVG